MSELQSQPLYVLELVTALSGDKDAIVNAVERLDADGQICVPSLGARFHHS